MTVRFRDLPFHDCVKLFGPFVLSVVLGILLYSVYPEHWLWSGLMHWLAHGFFVAGVIGIAVELFSVKFLIRRVADDLAERLVGRGLPAELQAHIRGIVDTDFVRDSYIKAYSFSAPTNGKVVIDVQISYEVRNYSDSVKDFVPLWGEEAFYEPEVVAVDYYIPGGGPSHSVSTETLKTLIKIDPTTKAANLDLKDRIKLEPISRNDKAVCRVNLRYRVTMPEEYSDVTSFVAATNGLTLRLDHLPNEFEFRSAGECLHHEPGSKLWRFERPFVHGQHVRAWWFRKTQATS